MRIRKSKKKTQWTKDTKGVMRIVNRRRTENTMAKGVMRIVNLRRTENTMDKRYQRGNENP